MLAHTTPEDFIRSVDQAKLERRRQRDAEMGLETRQLQPWERYRALIDHYDSLQDEAEHSDKKTRFALLILGTLNALNIVIVARPDILSQAQVPTEPVPGVVLYVICYVGLSLFLFVQAIVALKPRATPLIGKPDGRDRRLRHVGAIISQSAEEYLQGWREATIATVLKELAFHVQLSARAVAEKYVASGNPTRVRNRSTPPSFASASQMSCVRVSCQTMALPYGLPLSRSHATVVSRWFVMPMAARRLNSS